MNKIFSKIKEESGQALVIVAASIIVVLGATALSVDLGMAYNAKAELQAAADAIALAAAQDIPDEDAIALTVDRYAGLNGVDANLVEYSYPYLQNENQIEVTCRREIEYLFAKVLGFDSKVIEARAVAERRLIWGKETLPFMNIDDDYKTTNQIVLWEKTQTGDFEQLLNKNNHPEYEFTYDGDKKKTAINCYLNGLDDDQIDIRNGANASIESEIEQLCTLWGGDFIYVLSLETILDPPMNYVNANSIKQGGNIIGADIDLVDIVLLKCKIIKVDLSNATTRGITLEIDKTFDPIRLSELKASGQELPGFVNYDVRYRLVD